MSTPTILLVEDHDDSRLAERLLLERSGYVVVEARTGFDGLALSLATHPRVVLLDMVLPGIDGEQLARMLRADRGCKDVALVGLSASDDPELRTRALDAGCDEFIAKPVSPWRLVALVERYLRGGRRRAADERHVAGEDDGRNPESNATDFESGAPERDPSLRSG